MRRFFFAMHNRGLDVSEPCLRQKPPHLHLRKAQPQIGIHFAGIFVGVPHQIQHHNAAAGFQNAKGLAYRSLRVLRMVQRLAKERQVDALIRNRNRFQIALAGIPGCWTPCLRASSAPYSTIFSELSTAITCLARRASSWENVPSPAPRSAITSGGISSKQRFGQPFPGTPGNVMASELAGQLVEIGAHAILPPR